MFLLYGTFGNSFMVQDGVQNKGNNLQSLPFLLFFAHHWLATVCSWGWVIAGKKRNPFPYRTYILVGEDRQ